MFLKDLIAHWKENRKLKEYEELDKLVGSLVENYKQKLVLLNDFQTGRKDERVFKAEFLELLNVETSLEALGEALSHDENLIIEITYLKILLRKQNEALIQMPINLPELISKIREERKLLVLEQKDIKELEEKAIGPIISEAEIQQNLETLQKLGFPVKTEQNSARFLASNWNIFKEGLSIMIQEGLLRSKDDVAVLNELINTIKQKNLTCFFNCIAPNLATAGLLHSKKYLKLLTEFISKIKPEDLEFIIGESLPAMAKLGLINSEEDLEFLLELAYKTKTEYVYFIFKYGLPLAVKSNLIHSKKELKDIFLLMIEIADKTEPIHLKFIFGNGLPSLAYLIKSKDDLNHISNFLINLANKLKFENVGILFEYGFKNINNYIKNIDELKKINDILSDLLLKSHTLYRQQKEEFFAQKGTIVRRRFAKTDSTTILLGGKLIGQAIIRIISEPAFMAWKKAFEAKEVWQKAGFDYIPVEPILTKNVKIRAYKTKKGDVYRPYTKVSGINYYRVYTKVLGMNLNEFVENTSNEELIKQLRDLRERIMIVLSEKLKIDHGHSLHGGNFCVEVQNDKIRLYVIDFDLATIP